MLRLNHSFMHSMVCSLVAILGVWAYPCHADPNPRPFLPGSMPQILAAHQGQPFLLNLWSLDCPPCRKELELLADTYRQHPRFALVLIATDDIARAGEVQTLLTKYGLRGVESWIFAHPYVQRLRHEIDPQWFGELPRSYFYDAAHSRLGISGALQPQHLKTWLEAITPSIKR